MGWSGNQKVEFCSPAPDSLRALAQRQLATSLVACAVVAACGLLALLPRHPRGGVVGLDRVGWTLRPAMVSTSSRSLPSRQLQINAMSIDRRS